MLGNDLWLQNLPTWGSRLVLVLNEFNILKLHCDRVRLGPVVIDTLSPHHRDL
jgi:hypothetical protein